MLPCLGVPDERDAGIPWAAWWCQVMYTGVPLLPASIGSLSILDVGHSSYLTSVTSCIFNCFQRKGKMADTKVVKVNLTEQINQQSVSNTAWIQHFSRQTNQALNISLRCTITGVPQTIYPMMKQQGLVR